MKLRTHLSIGLFLISLATIYSQESLSIVKLNNTFLWYSVYFYFILVMYFSFSDTPLTSKIAYNSAMPIVLLLGWFLISLLRGIFEADNYWRWKNLIKICLVFFIPLISILCFNINFFSMAIKSWLKYSLPFFIIVFFTLQKGMDGAGKYLAPIGIITLFLSVLNKKYRIFFVAITFYVILDCLDARSTIAKFSMPLLLTVLAYFRFYHKKKMLNIIFIISLSTPFVFLFLGVSNSFNIFKFKEYVHFETNILHDGEGNEIDLAADTRSFLYSEVLNSAVEHDYILIGRTPARGNDSETFASYNEEIGLDSTERFSNEVAILNIFTWTGLVGVFFYFLVFAKAIFLAINRSKNSYVRLLGVYLCFRWCSNWVEDFTNFDLMYITMWMVIGLCYSKQLRNMSDNDVELWLKSMIYFRFKKIVI